MQILLDGAGPFGDPYQVNSANNGPYGDAPDAGGDPARREDVPLPRHAEARFTTGGSTGGWVSLALQVFYPDFFNGCWSQCPDSVDFRAYELIDIYKDDNAYVNRWGFERPSKRSIDGDVMTTVRHECQIEDVLGRGSRWELSGRDWAAWNATYGPKGADGLPMPLWDGKTGAMSKSVLEHWEKYDLRLVLERNWKHARPEARRRQGPRLGRGRGRLLPEQRRPPAPGLPGEQTDPKFDGDIQIEMRKPHTSGGWTERQMLDAMAGVRDEVNADSHCQKPRHIGESVRQPATPLPGVQMNTCHILQISLVKLDSISGFSPITCDTRVQWEPGSPAS